MRRKFRSFQYITGILLTCVILLNIYIYQPHWYFTERTDALLTKLDKANVDISNVEQTDTQLASDSFENNIESDIQSIIENKSKSFVNAVFDKDTIRIIHMLNDNARYISNSDGSSFIRHIKDEIHVEGYMASDKTLKTAKQRWQVTDSNGDVVSCMEVTTEEDLSPVCWYIHFTNDDGVWRISMLEN